MTAGSLPHTPYDGSSRPFTIGLKPIDPRDLIEPDALLLTYLAEKDRLIGERPDDVFAAEPETGDTQAEVLETLAGYLPARFPQTWSRDGATMAIAGKPGAAARTVHLSDDARPPLLAAARLVQEDLVIMRKGEDGWRLAAACVCFPSSWTLAEKFSRPLQYIHRPVPGFGAGTRNAEIVTRIFDNLKPGMAVERWNWSLSASNALHHPFSEFARVQRATNGRGKFSCTDPAAAFIRVERQTLSRLPRSGDILFTIRIHLDPLAVLGRHPARRELAAGFAGQLLELSAEQLAYKGLAEDRDRLVATMRAIAAA